MGVKWFKAIAILARPMIYCNALRFMPALANRVYELRHSYAVAALRSGDNIKMVQENLGHHTEAFTLGVYGHATEKMKRDSADRMQRYIDGLREK